MSAESGGSRHPASNSANGGSDGEPPEPQDETTGCEDLPAPADRLRVFLEEMGPVAHRPIADTHGLEVREEVFEEEIEEYTLDLDDGRRVRREQVTAREPVPVWQAVGEMLRWHEEYHESALRLEYGEPSDPTYELVDVDLDNSWMAAYQEQERAKLKALERETCGFEECAGCETRYCSEPDDHATEWVPGEFGEPVVVLTTRTASGAGRAPVDHAREIADAWKNGGVRRSLRHIVDKLGLESDEWVRWTQGEPHTGKRAGEGYGDNTGYHHPHDVLIFDEAAADGEIAAAAFRPMIEKHVEECAGAGPVAHDLDVEDWSANADDVGTVVVKDVGEEIEESVASYAASYIANESEDLLERSPEYLMWAATMWATGTQKSIKSDSANHAIAADRCAHNHETGDSELAHGEEVTTSACRCAGAPYGPGCSRCGGRGYHVVCLSCSSPWAVDQDETLVSRRVDGAGEAAADGGAEEPETPEERVEEDLRDRWPSARSAAAVEAPVEDDLDGDDVVAAGFVRPPSWSAKAVIRGGEKLPASGGSVNKKPLKLRSAPELRVSMAARVPGTIKCMECREMFDAPAACVDHGECAGTGLVGVGWRASTEPPAREGVMPAEEFVAAIPDRLRDGPAAADDDEQAGGAGDDDVRERVGRAVEEGAESVPAVLGRLGLAPDQREIVEEVVAARVETSESV